MIQTFDWGFTLGSFSWLSFAPIWSSCFSCLLPPALYCSSTYTLGTTIIEGLQVLVQSKVRCISCPGSLLAPARYCSSTYTGIGKLIRCIRYRSKVRCISCPSCLLAPARYCPLRKVSSMSQAVRWLLVATGYQIMWSLIVCLIALLPVPNTTFWVFTQPDTKVSQRIPTTVSI